jgi:pimeloyl-ACP methyl ester carboxylesterase
MKRLTSHRGIMFLTLVLVILVVSLQLVLSAEFSMVVTEQVWLTTNDGVRLNARIYRSKSDSAPMPGIVICHGFFASHQIMQNSFSLEFAKRGFLVVALDLRGHGDSGGNLELSTPLRPRMSPFDLFNETKLERDIRAAVDYLLSRTDVDNNTIAVLGHSLGGAAVFKHGYSDPRVKSVVAIAPALSSASEMDLTSPQNLLLVVGERDNIVRTMFVLNLLNRTTNGGDEIGTLYGTFSGGDARRMIVAPRTDHAGEMLDPYIVEEAIAWVEASLGIESNLPLSLSTPFILLLVIAGTASMLSIFPAMLCVKGIRRLTQHGNPSKPKSISRGVSELVLIYLGALVMGAMLSVLFVNAGLWIWVPVIFGELLIRPYLIASIILFFAFIVLKGTEQKLDLYQWGLKVDALKNALLGILGFTVVFSIMNVLLTQHFFDILPTARELSLMMVLFPFFLPLTFMDEVWVRNMQSRLSYSPWLSIGFPVILYFIPKVFLLALGSLIFGDFVLLASALLLIPSFFTAWLFNESGHFTGGATFNALFIAWIVAVIFPFG